MTAATSEDRADPSSGVVRRLTSSRWVIFGGLAAVVAISDQLTKNWVDSSFALATTGPPVSGFARPTPVLGEFVRIAKGYNDGGIFGLFGDSALVLGAASLIVIALIVLYQARQGSANGPLLSVALGFLLGGAVGNLIDRIRHGHVIDFVDMGIGDLRWYTFNVADASISTAIVLLIGLSLLGDRLPGGRPSRSPGEDG